MFQVRHLRQRTKETEAVAAPILTMKHRNVTNAAAAWAASPVGLLVRMEVLVTISCSLLAMLVLLGSSRRTCRRAAFRFVVWLALMLCYPAVSYTIGLMQSGFGSFRNDLVIVWACFLLGCADGIFACSVDDSDQQSRIMLNQATQAIYVLLLLLSYTSSLQLQLMLLLLLLWFLNVAKLGMRLWSRLSAGRDRVLTANNWLISKHMEHEYVRSVWDFDAGTMKGYRYVVMGQKDVKDGCAEYKLEVADDHDLITVDRVWQHEGNGTLLSRDNTVKDRCLSFALFKLLRRRLSPNLLLHERDDIRTLVFVRRGLAGGEDHKRMFRVIEVELGFLFDFFYARYPPPKLSLIPETITLVVAVVLSLSILFSPAFLRYQSPHSQAWAGNRSFVTTGVDIWLTRFVIALFVMLQLFQYLSLVLSDWHKVKMLCRYLRKPSWQGHRILEWLLWLMFRATLTTSYWSNSVGQYSLLHACLKNERSCLARVPLHKWIKGGLNRIRTVSHRTLPVSVKRAIHLLLRSEWLTNLKYGDRTLQRNNMLQDLDWSTSRYKHGGAMGSILVWHIATTICDMETASRGAKKQQLAAAIIAENREVATTLSNYCAYLLFQAPELVTDHTYDTRLLMEALQLRVQELLHKQGCRSNKDDMFPLFEGMKDDTFNKLSEFESGKLESGYEKAILADGIRLWDQVSNKVADEGMRWNFLSEMWVELLLSVAPSDNVTAHVKKLATGGELITHLWALLTHGGMIEKPTKPYYGS
ncbi:unnamed protein product [Urochloa decumbens]|uniref:DUF4220 domain-containing protein n=1 Tax=Urochloa decumbens TaxID=240449 RepID=A0ABC8XGC7_9POAL